MTQTEKTLQEKYRDEVYSQTIPQEIFNSITHGIGAALSIAALTLLIVFSAFSGSALKIVSFTIYGTTLFILFLSSTLLHSLRPFKAKSFFLKMDHISIYLLIAGTYTPLVLNTIGGAVGWTFFGIVWGIAVIGTVVKVFFTARADAISVILYIAMGWIVIFFMKYVFLNLPQGGIIFLFTGGLLYTGGTAFYLWRKLPFSHAIWHLFVLAAAICHFFCILLYV
ncbi:MAG: hemolysin III family protein [Spirochaetes bacterium]|nr:hemolysin III family protein [Spirochaetota bacterium]